MTAERTLQKIHFVEYTSKRGRTKGDKDDFAKVSVNVKFGIMSFGKKALSKLGMDSNWIKIYFEPSKKIIGWVIKGKIAQEEMKTHKLVKKNVNGQFVVSVSGILKQFIGLKKEHYTDLEVKKYRDYNSMLDDQTYYYVKLK